MIIFYWLKGPESVSEAETSNFQVVYYTRAQKIGNLGNFP